MARIFKYFRWVRRRVTLKGCRAEYLKFKETARKLAHSRVAYFNSHYGLRVGKIAIRNQKSRWGSCSKRGNLNFNYKIALIKPELADYVIVHELCHAGEFNHSKNFWALVAETVPAWRTLRKELNHMQIK